MGPSAGKAPAAAGFVLIRGADHDAFFGVREALAAIGGVSAYDANGEIFGDKLGNGHELRRHISRLQD